MACGNESHPGMLFNGEPMSTHGMSPEDIFEAYPKEKIPHKSNVNKVGIKLSALLKPLEGQAGNLHISTCGKKERTFSSEDLLSSEPQKSHYYLALTRKETLKLVHATDPNSKGGQVLKRITEIEVIKASDQ
ncbi:hypothetical protein GP5015_1123 [gamma proteobacterium HTCC5015]|nr:hypothetical protein GP5015_1123 [gamma proteobacterium HTCC5015]